MVRRRPDQIVHRFDVPLDQIPPGNYVFAFGSGNDGWFYDMGGRQYPDTHRRAGPLAPHQHP